MGTRTACSSPGSFRPRDLLLCAGGRGTNPPRCSKGRVGTWRFGPKLMCFPLTEIAHCSLATRLGITVVAFPIKSPPAFGSPLAASLATRPWAPDCDLRPHLGMTSPPSLAGRRRGRATGHMWATQPSTSPTPLPALRQPSQPVLSRLSPASLWLVSGHPPAAAFGQSWAIGRQQPHS
jgi:hypothetical protein